MILDSFIFPNKCPFCGKLTGKKQNIEYCGACEQCTQNIIFFKNGGNGLDKGLDCAPFCDKILCMFGYHSQGKTSMRNYKFGGETWIGKCYAGGMYILLDKMDILEDIFCITYVPVSPERFAERGFDQSGLMAEEISKMSGKIKLDLLVRKEQGKRSSELNLNERKESDLRKYDFNEKYKSYLKNKNVLLVDDILTTGSTVNECAEILKKNGCACVYVICTATGRRDV